MSEPIFIGCCRVGTVHPVSGSLVRHCSDCNAEVYVTPGSLIAAGRDAKLLCIPCVNKRQDAEGKEGTVMELQDIQKTELRKDGVSEERIQELSGQKGIEEVKRYVEREHGWKRKK